jgi:hypothetical protein
LHLVLGHHHAAGKSQANNGLWRGVQALGDDVRLFCPSAITETTFGFVIHSYMAGCKNGLCLRWGGTHLGTVAATLALVMFYKKQQTVHLPSPDEILSPLPRWLILRLTHWVLTSGSFHRVRTRMNIDDGDDPKVRRKSPKMEIWVPCRFSKCATYLSWDFSP